MTLAESSEVCNFDFADVSFIDFAIGDNVLANQFP
jgi:hypothetical protein